MLQALASDQLPKPRFKYSPVIKAGPWIIFSGMIALDRLTGALAQGGPGVETAKILANLNAALPDLGIHLAQLASARIYTTRFDEFTAINAAWEGWLGETPLAPARTSVGVTALPLGASVEIEFTFYVEN